MTERERFLAAFDGRATDRPPAYEQAFASDVASEILGREAYTGSVMLHYQEAVAAVRGPEAHREFLERMERDVVDLAKALKFGAVAGPWTLGPPTKQVGEYEFLYGDPEGEWVVYRYDPNSGTYGPVGHSRRPIWRGREDLKAQVQEAWRRAQRWEEEGKEDLVRNVVRWRKLAGDELEVLGRGGRALDPPERGVAYGLRLSPRPSRGVPGRSGGVGQATDRGAGRIGGEDSVGRGGPRGQQRTHLRS